jgi:hypothetical protein
MNPIFENHPENGIGYNFDKFIHRFTDICESHLIDNRAKAFAFILFDRDDIHVQNILSQSGTFTQLDRLAGKDLTVFYLRSDNTRFLKKFNQIFLGAFEITDTHNLPFILFFKVEDKEVVGVETVGLERTNEVLSFNEIYGILSNYIKKENEPKKKESVFNRGLSVVKKYSKEIAVKVLVDYIKGQMKEILN